MSMAMASRSTSEHADRLARAYREVGERTWAGTDFLEAHLASSRELYTPESLLARQPRPKALEVFALLAGLPFEPEFVQPLVGVQRSIGEVLGERLHYWVAPANLGVEYCVFKWPMESWSPERLDAVHTVLGTISRPAFRFQIGGIQINPDGCVVAKGFDEAATLFEIRAHVRSGLPSLPQRQSGWAHVPLGRILEPLGAARFAELARMMGTLADRHIATTRIRSMKLVHETRWYMEERTILKEYSLGAAVQEVRP